MISWGVSIGLFSLFGASMPKGEKMSISIMHGICMVGSTAYAFIIYLAVFLSFICYLCQLNYFLPYCETMLNLCVWICVRLTMQRYHVIYYGHYGFWNSWYYIGMDILFMVWYDIQKLTSMIL